MKFWIDENVPYSIAKVLKQAGHEAVVAPRKTDDGISNVALINRQLLFLLL